MLRKKTLVAIFMTCLLVLLYGAAIADSPIKTVSIADVGSGSKTVLMFTINVNRINCPGGVNPWAGLSILHPNGRIEDLPGKAVASQDAISWKWTPPGESVEGFMFTIAYWCGTQEKDRYPKRNKADKLTKDNVIRNNIPWRIISKNMTELNP